MRLCVLSSGSEGNSALVRAGECCVLVDSGLGWGAMRERLDAARLGPRALDHVLVTHGHLDHARSAGAAAKRHDATLHAPERILAHRALARAPRLAAVGVGARFELASRRARELRLDEEPLVVEAIGLPHDCDPTVAYRFEHQGRSAAIVTDVGHPDPRLARALRDLDLLVLEFNHDLGLMAAGPYPPVLQRRITGDRGHLSNAQAASLLAEVVGPRLHTLVLAHLSSRTNSPELALAAARATLERLGRGDVRVLVASQHELGPELEV